MSNTQSAVTDTSKYEKLLNGIEKGLLDTDDVIGLNKPFKLNVDGKDIELTFKDIDEVCDSETFAKQFADLIGQSVNEKGELGKLNDFNVFLTAAGVMASAELAMHNAFTMTPARAFCHNGVFAGAMRKKEVMYNAFVKYLNNMATDAKHKNPE